MRYHGDCVSDINIAYIGGGSREWAWGLMSDLALEGQLSGSIRLYDIDHEAAYANEIIGNRILNDKNTKGEWHYKAVSTLEQALLGADFVFISILPGTFEEMKSDVHTPEKYGIYQSVGDSAGPGGLIRALRAIPMFVEIAEAIKMYAPGAWVINYTNPMTLCTGTLYEVFPQIRAFGCCHEVFAAQELLVKMLKDMNGLEGLHREDIRVNVLGINHFTWIDKATCDGMDLIPLFGKFAAKYYESGFECPGTDDPEFYFESGKRVQFDLFRRYGTMSASGDRHAAEFCPPWYLKDPNTVAEWKFSLTPVSYRIKDRLEKIEKGKRLVSGAESIVLKPSGEEGVLQVKALLGLGDLFTNVNLPNRGQIKGLPEGSVVETNAVFSKNSVTPVFAGKMPERVDSLVLRQVYNQKTILEADLRKDKDLAFAAFANDPLVTLSIRDAEKLFGEMLRNTKAYLDGWEL